MFNRSKKVAGQFDWLLFLSTAAICIFGFIVLHSATASQNLGWAPMRSQIFATLIGFGIILLLQWVDLDFLKRLAIPIYGISIVLLLLTLLIGHGESDWGARSWLKLGPVAFQPSEFVKIGMILSLAMLLEKYHAKLNRPTTLLIILVAMGIPLFLILRQPDLGTCIVYAFFIALMIFYAGIHWGYILGAIVLLLIAIPLVYSRLTEIQKLRIINFLNPSTDPLGSSYQNLQGIIAIGSGQWLGRGYLQGTQTRFGFIPEQDTDYIFAVLSEEFGFVGGLALILCYGIMLYRMVMIARKAKDVFESTLCIGVAAFIFFHVFENIGMTIGVMPVTGIPLPLISNGGTFQMIVLTGIGLVLSASTQRRPLDFNAAF